MHSSIVSAALIFASVALASTIPSLRASADPIVCPVTRNLSECCTNVVQQNNPTLAPVFAPEHPDPNLYAGLACYNISTAADWSAIFTLTIRH
jgi:hypothetical protein